MRKLIVISGKQYSGKDTLCKILVEKLPKFKRVGIGDAIKIEYGKKNNLSFEEIEKNKHLYRKDLIDLGNWGRNINPDYWLNNLADMEYIIVPDVRVIHEVEFFKKKNALLIRVNSDYSKRSQRGVIVEENDSTETALDSYNDWDIVVENNSDLDSLKIKADKIIENFIG